jgi:hypothetical protein
MDSGQILGGIFGIVGVVVGAFLGAILEWWSTEGRRKNTADGIARLLTLEVLNITKIARQNDAPSSITSSSYDRFAERTFDLFKDLSCPLALDRFYRSVADYQAAAHRHTTLFFSGPSAPANAPENLRRSIEDPEFTKSWQDGLIKDFNESRDAVLRNAADVLKHLDSVTGEWRPAAGK